MTPGIGGDSALPSYERRVGKYRLLDLVGRGAMGQVYAAVDDHTGRKVAIKVINADLEGEPDIRARFFREAQTAARLVHRNVITIYDLGEDHGSPFIVMRYMGGGSLRDLLRSNREFDIGIALLAIVVVMAVLSAFSPYPPNDSFVVPPDVPPSAPALTCASTVSRGSCHSRAVTSWS